MPRVPVSLDDLLQDPLNTLAPVRRAGAVADPGMGPTVVTYDGVRALLADGRLRPNFVDFLHTFEVTDGPFHGWMTRLPLNRDGADHQRWRGLMSRTFTPRHVETIRPFLRRAAHELVDEFAAQGRCEFVDAFAEPYPSFGLCELIGVPQEDRARFRGWANAIGLGLNLMTLKARIDEIDEASRRLLAYTGELAAARRRRPQDDLVTRIAQAADEDGWSDDEIHGAIAGLVFAGHETTKNQLGWLVATLAEHADVWDGVARRPENVPVVVEEVLRYRSAATGVGRVVGEAVQLGEERFEVGEQVYLGIWSADHDERVFRRPDRVDPVANGYAPHLAFGHGAHHCLGAALARAEVQEALAALAARITCPRLEAGAIWSPPMGVTGPQRLPIAFEARREEPA